VTEDICEDSQLGLVMSHPTVGTVTSRTHIRSINIASTKSLF